MDRLQVSLYRCSNGGVVIKHGVLLATDIEGYKESNCGQWIGEIEMGVPQEAAKAGILIAAQPTAPGTFTQGSRWGIDSYHCAKLQDMHRGIRSTTMHVLVFWWVSLAHKQSLQLDF
jgi:hypothetical protein